MKITGANSVYVLCLEEGEEFMETLNKFCEDFKVRSGVILSGIGMLSDAEIGFYNQHSYDKKKLSGPHELISLSGNISIFDRDIVVHAHACLADSSHGAHAGHLFGGKICVTGEVVIMKLPLPLKRKAVTDTLKLLDM